MIKYEAARSEGDYRRKVLLARVARSEFPFGAYFLYSFDTGKRGHESPRWIGAYFLYWWCLLFVLIRHGEEGPRVSTLRAYL